MGCMDPSTSRRGFLASSAALVSGGILAGSASSEARGQEASRIEISNGVLTAATDPGDLDSRRYLTSLTTENRTVTNQPHEFSGYTPDGNRLGHRSTEQHVHLTDSGWEAINTQRAFAVNENSAVSVTHRVALPPDSPVLIVETEFENEAGSSITIDRPDGHITEGVMLIRTPPLYSPQGTYRYYVDGHNVGEFNDSDLWLPYEMDETRRFITYFGSEAAITTSYLDGHTEPIMGKTRTTEDVDDETGLPHSEENPPARQTIGFDVDCLDLCVDGFTLAPDESVEYAVAVSTHEGGENAVSSAREITETAESLWNDMPDFTPAAEEASFTAFFDRSDVDAGAASAVVGAGVLGGAGYLAYRWQRSSDDEEQPLTPPDDSSDLRSSTVETYDEITIGAAIETHKNIQINQGTSKGEETWVLTPAGGGETIDTNQFQNTLAQLKPWTNIDDHQHLLSVYGHGMEPLPWIAVEPAEYLSLRERADSLTINEKVNFLIQVCEAVHHIQRYGLAYERLSPESVLITDDTVTLRGILDYATADGSGYELPAANESSAVEQADVYRLGALAYEVLTGARPEQPDPASPSKREPSLPATVDEVLMPALSHDTNNRHETVLHLRDELRECFGLI